MLWIYSLDMEERKSIKKLQNKSMGGYVLKGNQGEKCLEASSLETERLFKS